MDAYLLPSLPDLDYLAIAFRGGVNKNLARLELDLPFAGLVNLFHLRSDGYYRFALAHTDSIDLETTGMHGGAQDISSPLDGKETHESHFEGHIIDEDLAIESGFRGSAAR